jgi:hypothetical protein
MKDDNEYIPGTSHLVDYAIEHFGAEVVGVEKLPETRPPFPGLTGALNTSSSYRIDKNVYPHIVAAGVDTLELNFGVAGYRQPDMFKRLNDAKSEAVSAGYKGRRGITVDLFGQEFMVQAHGSRGGYEYLLTNGDIALQMMPDARGGKPSPEVRIVFRSPFLWRVGEVPACNQVIEFLNQLAILGYCKVSRADLCVDMVMPLPDVNRKTQVVSVSREKDLYYGGDYLRGQRETGFQFGRGGIVCRFYDKAYEISVKGNGHIVPLWMENGWDGESPVSRFELQLRREGLKRFDKDMDFVTFQDIKPDIWAYITDKYIRIVKAGSATRKERARVTDYWREYQSCAGLFGERLGVLPYRHESRDWKPLVNQATGCLASAWARLAADVGDAEATLILEKAWEQGIPGKVVEAGLLQKTRFAHLS